MSDVLVDPAYDEASGGEDQRSFRETFRKTATRADLLDVIYATCPSLSRTQARDIFEMA